MNDDHLIPNTTQVPNSIIDLLMPFLHDGEARVLLYLCRRTFGFGRDTDHVSLDQFVQGIRGIDQQQDFGAGVSRRSAIYALLVLKEIGIVEQLEGGQGRGRIPLYRLNRKCEMMQHLHVIAQSHENPREIIMQRLHLIREKHAPVAPLNRKPRKDKPLKENMQEMHVLEKVQVTTVKGASEFLQPLETTEQETPTKPSIQNQEKETPPTPSSGEPATSPKRERRGTRHDNQTRHAPEAFEQFYQAYPRHLNPDDAMKAWDARQPDETLQALIIENVQARAKNDPEWMKDQGKYVPYPATYLRNARWKDEWKPQTPKRVPIN